MTIIKEEPNCNSYRSVNLNAIFNLLEIKDMVSIQDICNHTIDYLMQEHMATPSQIQPPKRKRSYQCKDDKSIKEYSLAKKVRLASAKQEEKNYGDHFSN